MKFCQLIQQSLTFRQEGHLHDPVVTFRLTLANEAAALSPLDKANHGVMALLQKFGQFGDGGRAPVGEPCNTEEQLMLLGSQAL